MLQFDLRRCGPPVVRVRLDKTATSISLLVALGVRADGQKMLLAIRSMGGEGEAAWRALLDDLVRRGAPTPELVVVDGAPGLEKALAALWPNMAVQRCTVHKHRNLLAHAPERLHEEISNDYKDIIYAQTKGRSKPGARPSSANGAARLLLAARRRWRQRAAFRARPALAICYLMTIICVLGVGCRRDSIAHDRGRLVCEVGARVSGKLRDGNSARRRP